MKPEALKTEMSADTKADLISIGSARIDKSLLPGQLKGTAKTGPEISSSSFPEVNSSSFFLRAGKRRVRLAINDQSPLSVDPEGEQVVVIKGDEVIARGVIEHPLCHCPEQAYITISEKCVYDCQFCSLANLQGGTKSSEKVQQMVAEAYATGELKAISLTSGIAVSPKKEVDRMAGIVKLLARKYDIPIGVSVYPTKDSSEELYSAGACEVKYNVGTMDPYLFRSFSPHLSLHEVLDALENAVNIFGRNRVSSNLIIGLGENDETIRKGIMYLTGRCIIPILRPRPIATYSLKTTPGNVNRPDAVRLLRLGGMLRNMLDKQSLCVDKSRTMCLLCTACDITPHVDV